jgi:fatty acid desaturase
MLRVAACTFLALSVQIGHVYGFLQPVISNLPTLRPGSKLDVVAVPSDVKDDARNVATKTDRLEVALDGVWYDLTRWRSSHPAGEHWIDRMNGKDATDVMTAFHSEEAMKMFQGLPKAQGREDPVVDQTTLEFRKFRAQLVADGWFKRNWVQEAKVLGLWLTTCAVSVWLAKVCAPLGLIGLGIVSATGGWLSHDYVHGRGPWCTFMRNFGCLSIGLSPKWWSEKHNKHHAWTNVIGVDEDIMVDPALFLWQPDPSKDVPWRRFQHLYWAVPFSITLWLWRFDSIKRVVKDKLWGEGIALAANYAFFLYLLGPAMFAGMVTLGGLLIATIVTVTHQAEEYLPNNDGIGLDGQESSDDPSFVDMQFRTTRDAICRDPVSEYIWGGMQYQLEHHLFPIMPRYKYSKLAPVVKEWAEKVGLDYRATDQWQIISDNINYLKKVGEAPALKGAPTSS